MNQKRILLALVLPLLCSLAATAQAQEKKSGTIMGEVKAMKNTPDGKNVNIDVLAFGEEKARRYFVLHDPKLKAPMPKVVESVRKAAVGDHVKLVWEYTGHGPAIKSFQVLKKGAGSETAVQGQKENDAIKPVPRPDKWMDRHNKFNERVAKGHVDLVFIGDSITQGWEGNGKKAWEKYYGKRHAVNLGIGGDRTQHVIWRLQNGNLKGISPKLAVVMIGTNNAAANAPEETAEGVKHVVKEIHHRSPKTKILLLAIFPRGENAEHPLRQKNDKVNAIIQKLADNKHVFFLDIGKNFLQDDGTLPKEIMPDLLHLSPRGYDIWAESIEKKVAELMGH